MKSGLLTLTALLTLPLSALAQAPAGFIVTSPNSSLSWQGVTNHTISWNVAGTADVAPYVDILLSTDGGATFTENLALKVPNDGSEVILLPNTVGTTNRIKVRKYNDDTLSDVSDANFTITEAGSTFGIKYEGERIIQLCRGNQLYINGLYETYNGYNAVTEITSSSQVIYVDNSVFEYSETASARLSGLSSPYEDQPDGIYPITVTAVSGSEIKTLTLYVQPVGEMLRFGNVFPLSYTGQPFQAVTPNPTFSWELEEFDGTGGDLTFEVSIASDSNFGNIIHTATTSESSYTANLDLQPAMIYYWHVKVINSFGCEYFFYSSSNGNERLAFVVGEYGCTTYSSQDIPANIAANSISTSALNLGATTSVDDLKVKANLTYTSLDGLTINLISPMGTEVTLIDGQCPDSNAMDITFDDEGINLSCSPGTLTGTIIPEEALSLFHGEAINGQWQLEIVNSQNSNGILNSWSIEVCTVSLGVNDEPIEQVSLYPNPNNGDFTVSFNSTTGKPVNVAVYDMAGRQIISREFANTGTIEQNISLGNAQAGVYMVAIQDGASKFTKKIVIN